MWLKPMDIILQCLAYYIRDLLGHSSIKTTEIYTRTNEELLRKNILIASNIEINKEIPKWQKDEELLKSLLDL